jgi:TonB family protein
MLFVAMVSIGARPAFANDDGGRRIKSKVAPVYPDLARRMNVTGSVKVQIVIAPNGTVKSTKVIGGHPLLIEPSLDAVRKWRYEPSNEETIETVEFKFTGTE